MKGCASASTHTTLCSQASREPALPQLEAANHGGWRCAETAALDGIVATGGQWKQQDGDVCRCRGPPQTTTTPRPHTPVSAHDAQRTHGGAERCGFCGDRRRECFTEKDARQRTGRSVWAVGAGRVGQGRGGPLGEGEHADLQAWVLQLKLILAFWRAPECKLGSLNTKDLQAVSRERVQVGGRRRASSR